VNFTFLHPEFFLWMLPPIMVLFYFWLTQQSREYHWFSPEITEKLRAPETTMGLRGRNILFLAASVLMITAMAQPVVLQKNDIGEGRADILIALDISKKSFEAFNEEKAQAIALVRSLAGERIAVIAYDQVLYRITPSSVDAAMIISLIQGVNEEVMQEKTADAALVNTIRHEGVVVHIGSTKMIKDSDNTVYLKDTSGIKTITEKIKKSKEAPKLYAHIPLFPYPLGFSMLLVWIALSSMSKRRSVPLAMVVLILFPSQIPIIAGVLDFKVLNEGYEAYEKGAYKQSAEQFRRYQLVHDSAEIRYNLANALFKAGRYEQARYWYRQVYTENAVLAQRTAYNLFLTEKILSRETKEGKKGEKMPEQKAFQESKSKKTIGYYGEKTRLFRFP